MYKISKTFVMSCSHRLYDETLTEEENKAIFGKCTNLHGHNNKITLTLKGEHLNNGMLMNFNGLKAIFNEYIDSKYDHQHLNDVMKEIPTAENLARQIYRDLRIKLRNLVSVKVEETDGSWAEYTPTE